MKQGIFRSLAAAAIVMSASSIVSADDYVSVYAPPAPVGSDANWPGASNWSGFYGGITGSVATGTNNLESFGPGDPARHSFSSGGFGGDVHAGYNFQQGNIVFGVEGDIGLSNVGSRIDGESPLIGNEEVTNTIDWSGSIRGRLGHVFEDTLVYGTAGVAVAGVSNDYESDVDEYGREGEHWGWTVGAGLEHALSDKLSLRTEYLYSDFGAEPIYTSNGGSAGVENSLNSHAIRTGLTFRF